MKRFVTRGAILLSALFFIHIALGTYTLSLVEMWQALWHAEHQHHFTLVEYRLPRAILAVVLGASLAVSGTLIQTVMRNPLASPDILGISQAGGLLAIVVILFFPQLPFFWLPILAFVGGLLAFAVLWLIAGFQVRPLKMAMIGVALSALWSALGQYLLLRFPVDANVALLWLTGSLWGRSWSYVVVVVPFLLILLPLSLRFCRDLDILALGELKAPTLGVALQSSQVGILLLAVALATTAVAVAGPMAFLGLVAPHMARFWVGGVHRALLPCAMGCGAILLLIADILARMIAPPIELPAGILTAILGAPYFFYLLLKR